MKAKKIIAIGLVAAMTLGMSTSVFATESNPYDDYPQFNEWDTPYGPTDNVFHAKGQGWLESGVGINESVTNVIVPTTPNINIRYGQPGLFDFGFDPQRLVQRTGALKYAGKENFTEEAKESGVYFINEPKLLDDEERKNENTYDNKSVKLKGTNIGTEPVAFTVSATLAGGQNFAYLEEEPSAPTVVIKANELYQSLYNTIGGTWGAYVSTAEGDMDGNITRPVIHENPTMLDMAKDIALGTECSYNINDVQFNDEQKQAISDALAIQFKVDQETKDLWGLCTLVAPSAQSVDGLLDALSAYEAEANTDEPVVPSDKVGMFLGLNVASGNEETTSGGYEDAATETAFKVANEEAGEDAQKIDAAANFTQVVEGTPTNYDMVWDEGMKDYRKVIISKENDLYKPFQTVAFWFRGVATNNDSVAEDVKIPALEFTWTFSKEIPEPEVITPKLAKVNGADVSPEFAAEPVFGVNQYGETGVTLTFDFGSYAGITDITFSVNGNSYYPYANPDQYFTINGNILEVNPKVFGIVKTDEAHIRYWKVSFGEADVILTFVPEVN